MDNEVLQALARAHRERSGLESLSMTSKDARQVGLGCGIDRTSLRCTDQCNVGQFAAGYLVGLEKDIHIIDNPNPQCVILCLLTRGKSGRGRREHLEQFHPTFRALYLRDTFRIPPDMSDEVAECIFRPVVQISVETTENVLYMRGLIDRNALNNLISVSIRNLQDVTFDLSSLPYLQMVNIEFATPTNMISTRHRLPQSLVSLSVKNFYDINGDYTLDLGHLHLHSVRDTSDALRRFTFRNMPLTKLFLRGLVRFPLPPNVSAVCLDVSNTNRTVQELYDASTHFGYITAIWSLVNAHAGLGYNPTRNQVIANLTEEDRRLLELTGPAHHRAYIRVTNNDDNAWGSSHFTNFLDTIKMRPVIDAVNLRI